MAPFQLKWTTPTRRVGKRLLPLVPNEIYLNIFSYVETMEFTTHEDRVRRIYPSLANTCRFFCAYFLPLIFSEIKFIAVPPKDKTLRAHTKLSRALAMGKGKQHANSEPTMTDFLCSHVQKCVFQGWGDCASGLKVPSFEPDFLKHFLDMYTIAFRRMSNMSSLILVDTLINGSMLATISSFPCLTSLCIRHDGSPFAIDVLSKKPALSNLNLKSFTYAASVGCTETNIFDHLCACLQKWELEAVELHDWPLAENGLFHSKKLDTTLKRLRLRHVPEIPPLIDFLGRLTAIETLEVEDDCSQPGSGDSRPRLGLRRGSMPKLSTVRCSSTLLGVLVPGRPVEHVHIDDTIEKYKIQNLPRPYMPMLSCDYPRFLRQSSAIITELHVDRNTYIAYLKDAEMLGVKVLVIEPGYSQFDASTASRRSDDIKAALISAIEKIQGRVTSQLSRFEWKELMMVNDRWLNLSFQHTIIRHVAQTTLPSATTICISPYIEWRCSSASSHNPASNQKRRKWKPFIYHSSRRDIEVDDVILDFRKAVEVAFHNGESQLADFDGLYTRLLPDNRLLQTRLAEDCVIIS